VHYSYDWSNQVQSVTATQPGHSAVNLATSIVHYPFGPILSLTYGNGVTDSRTYDLAYRMTNVTDTGTSGVQNLTYGYDADSNVTGITDAVNASKALVFAATYDPNGKATITTSTITQNLRQLGQYNSNRLFYHNGFRDSFYPVGRYGQPDLLGIGASSPYPYAGSNTNRFTDRLGLCPNGDVMCDIAMRQAGLPQFAGPDQHIQLSPGQQLALMMLGGLFGVDELLGLEGLTADSALGLTPEATAAPEAPAITPGAQCTVKAALPISDSIGAHLPPC
jgi:YD repeat-containing protein